MTIPCDNDGSRLEFAFFEQLLNTPFDVGPPFFTGYVRHDLFLQCVRFVPLTDVDVDIPTHVKVVGLDVATIVVA